MRRDGIRFVVVSDQMRLNFDVQRDLRDLLQSKQFRLRGRFPIRSTGQPAGNLLLYENELWAPPTDKFLDIRMMTLRNDIVVPFNQFDLTGDPVLQPQSHDGK
jgi:hypothetical protein